MTRALDRLLADVNALRTLRKLVATPNLTFSTLEAHGCCCRSVHKGSARIGEQIRPKQAWRGSGQRSLTVKTVSRGSEVNGDRLSGSRRLNDGIPGTPSRDNGGSFSAERLRRVETQTGNFPEQPLIRRVRGQVESQQTDDNAQLLDAFRAQMRQSRAQRGPSARSLFMDLRRSGKDIPFEGAHAQKLWDLLLGNSYLFDDIFNYAVDYRARTGIIFNRLYFDILGFHLKRSHYDSVREWHHRFLSHYVVPSDAMRVLAPVFVYNPSHLSNYRSLYESTGQRNIYDTIVPLLHKRRMYEEAKDWHSFLVKLGDLPTRHLDFRPFSEEINTVQSEKDVRQSSLDEYDIFFTSSHTHRYGARAIDGSSAKRTSSSSDAATTDTSAASDLPTELNDTFGARLFATRAISIEFAIEGLRTFGVESIGPSTLRQLALRSITTPNMTLRPALLTQNLRKLLSLRIKLRDCVFSRAVVKLSKDSRSGMLQDLLRSNQHPDNFDDDGLQADLLHEYTSQNRSSEAHLVLYILTNFHKSPDSVLRNELLVQQIRNMSWPAFWQVFDDCRHDGWLPSNESVAYIVRKCLTLRTRSARPRDDKVSLENLAQATRFLKVLVTSGYVVEPRRWLELIKQIGMLGQWYTLSPLLLFLAKHYCSNTATSHETTGLEKLLAQDQAGIELSKAVSAYLPFNHADHPLRILFPPIRQASILQWGFKAGFSRELEAHLEEYAVMTSPRSDEQQTRRWERFRRYGDDPSFYADFPSPTDYPLRGLVLLMKLRELGVPIAQGAVLKALKDRLWQLYSPIAGSNDLLNRRARQINPWTLEDMNAHIASIIRDCANPCPSDSYTFDDISPSSSEDSFDARAAAVSDAVSIQPSHEIQGKASSQGSDMSWDSSGTNIEDLCVTDSVFDSFSTKRNVSLWETTSRPSATESISSYKTETKQNSYQTNGSLPRPSSDPISDTFLEPLPSSHQSSKNTTSQTKDRVSMPCKTSSTAEKRASSQSTHIASDDIWAAAEDTPRSSSGQTEKSRKPSQKKNKSSSRQITSSIFDELWGASQQTQEHSSSQIPESVVDGIGKPSRQAHKDSAIGNPGSHIDDLEEHSRQTHKKLPEPVSYSIFDGYEELSRQTDKDLPNSSTRSVTDNHLEPSRETHKKLSNASTESIFDNLWKPPQRTQGDVTSQSIDPGPDAPRDPSGERQVQKSQVPDGPGNRLIHFMSIETLWTEALRRQIQAYSGFYRLTVAAETLDNRYNETRPVHWVYVFREHYGRLGPSAITREIGPSIPDLETWLDLRASYAQAIFGARADFGNFHHSTQYQRLARAMTPECYRRLVRFWPSPRSQRKIALEAVFKHRLRAPRSRLVREEAEPSPYGSGTRSIVRKVAQKLTDRGELHSLDGRAPQNLDRSRLRSHANVTSSAGFLDAVAAAAELERQRAEDDRRLAEEEMRWKQASKYDSGDNDDFGGGMDQLP